MAYHKRRPRPAPNKNQAKALRRQEITDQPRLGHLYPSVERLFIKLRFNDSKGNFLDDKTLAFGTNDQVNLRVHCLGRCGNGEMDLEGKLKDVIEKGETVSESRGKCTQLLFADSSEACGYELQCRIEVSYR